MSSPSGSDDRRARKAKHDVLVKLRIIASWRSTLELAIKNSLIVATQTHRWQRRRVKQRQLTVLRTSFAKIQPYCTQQVSVHSQVHGKFTKKTAAMNEPVIP